MVVILALVDEPVVQPALPALPKLDPVGTDPEAAPEVGDGNMVLALEAPLDVVDPALQPGPAVVALDAVNGLENLALPRRPGADARPPHAGVEVGLALGGREPLGAPLDADLPLQGLPEEEEGGVGVGGQVAGLEAGAQVRVDDEGARRVEFLEVDHAGGYAARGEFCGG